LTWVPNYERVVFKPFYGKDPTKPGEFNFFTGYRHKILPDNEYDPTSEDFRFVMDHWLVVMCSGNTEYLEYLMKWLGWLLRHGWLKPRTAIVMHGGQGLGKDTMWTDLVWYGILGKKYAHKETSMKRFTEKFNLRRMGKMLHIFNECTVVQKNSQSMWDQMKAVVTDRDFMAEGKGKEAFAAVDCAGVVLLSNHTKPCDIANDDRRYAVTEMALEKPDSAHYTRLRRLVKDRVIQRTFFTYLIKLDVPEDWDMGKIPLTESRKEIISDRFENLILEFLRDLVMGEVKDRWFDFKYNEEELKPDQRWYNPENIFETFEDYRRKRNLDKYNCNVKSMTKSLERHGLETGRKRCRDFCHSGHGSQQHRGAWRLDRDAIRNLHRTRMNDPEWEYPE
jgi:hypothetical protein